MSDYKILKELVKFYTIKGKENNENYLINIFL